MEQKTSLRELTKEEFNSFNEAFAKFQEEQKVTLRAVPQFVANEKGEFVVVSKILVLKIDENVNEGGNPEEK